MAAETRELLIQQLLRRTHGLTAVKKLGHRIDLTFGQGRCVAQNVMELFPAIPATKRVSLIRELSQAADLADQARTSPILLRQPAGLARLFSGSPAKVLTFDHEGDGYTIAMGQVVADSKNPGSVKQRAAVIQTSGTSREVTIYTRTAQPPSWLPRALWNRLPEGFWSEPQVTATKRGRVSPGKSAVP